jgi:N-acetylneuraminate synthase
MRSPQFNDLFVLELANNHWGKLDRGLKIIHAFGRIVRSNGVKAAIKLQFRDLDSFVHSDHRHRQDHRYIKKILATQMSWENLRSLLDAIRAEGMTTMVTPFDEVSVDRCVELDVEFLKIASSDIRDKFLIEKIASTGKPVIASTGGASLQDIDGLVAFFKASNIQFAVNHCVAIYPSADDELDLNQIDFLRARYPGTVIGLSTHECTDWKSSVMIAYAKGARTFERHIDINADGVPVSPYCTLPEQADVWFKAFNKAREMCGGAASAKRVPPDKEVRYLEELVRGVYARRALPPGHVIAPGDVYLAVPLMHGQISCRELTYGEVVRRLIEGDAPVHLREIDSVASDDLSLQRLIESRGAPPIFEADDPLCKVA